MNEEISKIRSSRRRALAAANYENNSRRDADPETTTLGRTVNDQNGMTGRTFLYGDYPARHNACEAIAVHNARVLTGERSRLSDVIVRFQASGAMIRRGYFGSNVFKIGRVLKSYGVKYKRLFRRKFDRPGVYIVSFWNEKPLKNGIHTVAFTFDGEKYTTYNLHGGGKASDEAPGVYAKHFIVGYYIADGDALLQ